MTAPPNIDPARFLSEQLDQAIPDLMRSMMTKVINLINALMSAEARAIIRARFSHLLFRRDPQFMVYWMHLGTVKSSRSWRRSALDPRHRRCPRRAQRSSIVGGVADRARRLEEQP